MRAREVAGIIGALVVAVTLAACGEGSNPVSPSAAGNGSTLSIADAPPTGNAALSCPHDAPTGLFVSSGELVNDSWKNDVSFRPVVNISRYLVEVTNRATRQVVAFEVTGSTQVTRYDLTEGVQTARVKGECGDGQGVWSAPFMFTNGHGSFGPDVPVTPEEPEACYDWKFIKVKVGHHYVWKWVKVEVPCEAVE